jgi:hypothetical protein
MSLCADALAQDRAGAPEAQSPKPATTTGAAPSGPAMQMPKSHRQPRTDTDATSDGGISFAPVSPYDQEIDRNLQICRGC